MRLDLSLPKDIRKLVAFGTGVGIEIGPANLEIAAVRIRPTGVRVLGRTTIAGYATRPAAEWGVEYTHFLRSLGLGFLTATVLLPRRDVIVRHVALPGVATKDIEGAIRFQLDSLHPYGEDEVSWGWAPLAFGAVLVGIARRSVVDQYIRLFTEAGVTVSNFTFSAAAIHAAIRANGAPAVSPDPGFVAIGHGTAGGMEVYGESGPRPVFSAQLDVPPERATMLALAELRLSPETEALALEQILPKPSVNPVENDLSREPLPYATALAGACPRLAPAVNVLPAEHRKYSSRAGLVAPMVFGGLLVLAAAGLFIYSHLGDRTYLEKINAEISTLEPRAQRAAAAEREIGRTRARTQLLDKFRSQTRADLESLKELSRIIEPPSWTSSIDLQRDVARLSGEAPQAAPLLKILDSSPLFENSVLDMAPRGGGGELFQIHTSRENTK